MGELPKNCLKGGGKFVQLADLREGLGKKEGGSVFERGEVDTLMHTMKMFNFDYITKEDVKEHNQNSSSWRL